MKKFTYQDSFHPAFWVRLSQDERILAFQQLENDQARKTGREPYKIRAVEIDKITQFGKVSFENKQIGINAFFLEQDHMLYINLFTILHEGRHAYQHDAINKKVEHDPDEVKLWRANDACYVHPNSPETAHIYIAQPLERDADAYANKEINKIIRQLKNNFGEILLAEAFIRAEEDKARTFKAAIEEKYGKDYEIKIDNAMHRYYEKSKNEQKSKIEFRSSVRP